MTALPGLHHIADTLDACAECAEYGVEMTRDEMRDIAKAIREQAALADCARRRRHAGGCGMTALPGLHHIADTLDACAECAEYGVEMTRDEMRDIAKAIREQAALADCALRDHVTERVVVLKDWRRA